MTEVVGVRFKEVGKIYYFAPNSIKLKLGDYVIVETARGVECGQIAMTNRKINDDDIVHPLKKIIRKANEEDILRIEENRKKEKEAFKICGEKIAQHKLSMKLVDVEYTLDNSKILFYFTADGRVDFRERQNAGRNRNMRQTVLLFIVFGRISACFYKNGKGAGLIIKSRKDFGNVRKAYVLS